MRPFDGFPSRFAGPGRNTAFSLLTVLLLLPGFAFSGEGGFTFSVTCDMRKYCGVGGSYDSTAFFRGACEAIALHGPGEFMVSPGDIDPPVLVRQTIEQVLGADHIWFPNVGNHEAETESDMEYLRQYVLDPNGEAEPNLVRTGPPGSENTTYSFRYGGVHFSVINEYYDGTDDDGTDGDVTDALYEWLDADLAAAETEAEHLFVIGHEPARVKPDAWNDRLRHMGDSLDKYPANRDRFWDLMARHGVVAYFCGHTHNTSVYWRDGVWQLDAGHCRGRGDQNAPSTVFLVRPEGERVVLEIRRDIHDGLYDYEDIVEERVIRAPGGVVPIVDLGAVWKYRDEGNDPGGTWHLPDYDDGAWESGPAPLGYGEGDEGTVVDYGPDPYEKHITTYFRRAFPAPVDRDRFLSLVVRVSRDDAAIVYLNGSAILWSNLDRDSVVTHETRASRIVGGEEDERGFIVALADPSLLRSGENVLAAEVHQANGGSSDLRFDLDFFALADRDSTDTDGDGIIDLVEGGGDRDGDGVPNGEDYDPTGRFYDEVDGRILTGGRIDVDGPGAVTIHEDGSGGCYRFSVDAAGVYRLTVTAPPGYERCDSCPALPETLLADPDDPPSLGPGEEGDSGYLAAAGCTTHAEAILFPGPGAALIDNNFPFRAFSSVENGFDSMAADANGEDVVIRWSVHSETEEIAFRLTRISGSDSTSLDPDAAERTDAGEGEAAYEFRDRPEANGAYRYVLEARVEGETIWKEERTVLFAGLPVRFGLRVAGPNPFRSTVGFRIEIPERTVIEADLYDTRGRRVRRLAAGETAPGTRVLEWNGRDDRGEPVPSGVYFLRLRSGFRVLNTRVTHLR